MPKSLWHEVRLSTSISHDAKVLVLGPHGYETRRYEGKNGFVCVVERGWMGPFEGALSANF